MNVERLASAIYNDIVSGLRGYRANPSINLLQLLDEIISTRLNIINQLFTKGLLPVKDLLYSINCVKVDCKSLDNCPCSANQNSENIKHFEIPDIVLELGKKAISYVGSTDKMHPFDVVFSMLDLNNYKYRKIKTNKPKVYISGTVNNNGLLDCYIFGAPFVKLVSITAAFKDPRLISNSCEEGCSTPTDKITFLDLLVLEKLTKEKIQYYRLLAAPIKPNNLQYE